jgi:hypothetical protein
VNRDKGVWTVVGDDYALSGKGLGKLVLKPGTRALMEGQRIAWQK